MPSLGKTFRRRRAARRKAASRAMRPTRAIVPRYRGGLKPNFLTVTRVVEGTSITASSSGAYATGLSFNINGLPDLTDFTTLFDQYKLNGIQIQFIPNITSNDMNPVSTYYELPNFHTIIDRDDEIAPANLNVMMQYPSYKRTRGHQVHTRYFRPSLAQTIFKTSSTTGTSQVGPKWLDCADPTIPHYGMKVWIDQTNSTTNIKYRVYTKYYLQFKGVR